MSSHNWMKVSSRQGTYAYAMPSLAQPYGAPRHGPLQTPARGPEQEKGLYPINILSTFKGNDFFLTHRGLIAKPLGLLREQILVI